MARTAPSRQKPASRGKAAPREAAASRAGPERAIAAMLESFDFGMALFGQNLALKACNSAARAMLGDAITVTSALDRLTAEGGVVDWQSEVRKVLSAGRSHRFDALATGQTGQPERWLEVTIAPMAAADGSNPDGMLIVQDVTTRITMERRLAVSERLAAVGKLAARVAHELNNPLDGILRYINLAARRLEQHGDDKLMDYLNQARSGIHRMAQIVAALLEFSRSAPAAGEQVTLNRLIEDAIEALEGRAREAGVTVVCNFNGTDVPVAHGTGLFQVACNLIKNAIDAMPGGGTLSIATAIIDGHVVMTVDDTGVGLPEEMERIFEPFYTTKEAGRGTGLGLAVCKELMERFGGSITPSRRTPRGTRMTLRFPLPVAPQGPADGAASIRRERTRGRQSE